MRSAVLESRRRTNREETPSVGTAREHPASKPRLRNAVGASELAERLDGRRWALVTDELEDVLDQLQCVETPPSAVLVPARQYLLAKAEFPAARVATHPDELRTCPLELAVSWDRGHAPRVRACLVFDGIVSDASTSARPKGGVMSRPAFRHVIDALHCELDTPGREPARQVMRAIGDEHDWPRRTIGRRLFDANHAFEATS